MFDVVTSLFSPHDFNPLNLNPLKDVLEVSVDFEALRRRACPIKLFLSANQRARPLPVQRLIPAELFEQDHRQQTWAREAARVTWNGGRRLRVAAPCRQAVQRRGFMPFGLRCASMLCTAADFGRLGDRRLLRCGDDRRPTQSSSPPCGHVRAKRATKQTTFRELPEYIVTLSGHLSDGPPGPN